MNRTVFVFFAAALLFASRALAAADTLDAKAAAFLAGYERVRSALADDDLAAARAAAHDLEGAAAIAAARSLGEARRAFKTLSATAVALAKGQPGLYVAHCPMVPGGGADWVQTTPKIANPYWGKSMLRCGEIVAPK